MRSTCLYWLNVTLIKSNYSALPVLLVLISILCIYPTETPGVQRSKSRVVFSLLRPELHKIPARMQCTVQCADWIDEPAPPTIP
jgi:hypothetical protein